MYYLIFSSFLKRSSDGSSRKFDGTATVDGVKYTAMSEIQQSNISPKIHILTNCPNGKTELLWKIEKTGDKEYIGKFKKNCFYIYFLCIFLFSFFFI